MKLTTVFFTLCFSVVCGLTAIAQVTKATAEVKSEVRELKGFNRVVAQGLFNLYLVQGQAEGLKIETNENIIELFQTRIEDKTLYISMISEVRKYKELNVYLMFKDLTEIILMNEIYLKSENLIHFSDVTINGSGVCDVNVELYAANLSVNLVDGSRAYFKGYTDNLTADMHDETELNAFDMQTINTRIVASGLSETMVNVQKNLYVFATGASNIYYIGEATIPSRLFSSTGFIVKRKNTTAANPPVNP